MFQILATSKSHTGILSLSYKAPNDGSGFTDAVDTRGREGGRSWKRLFKGFGGSGALRPFKGSVLQRAIVTCL